MSDTENVYSSYFYPQIGNSNCTVSQQTSYIIRHAPTSILVQGAAKVYYHNTVHKRGMNGTISLIGVDQGETFGKSPRNIWHLYLSLLGTSKAINSS